MSCTSFCISCTELLEFPALSANVGISGHLSATLAWTMVHSQPTSIICWSCLSWFIKCEPRHPPGPFKCSTHVLHPWARALQNITVWLLEVVRNLSLPLGAGIIPWEFAAWAMLNSNCLCRDSSSFASSNAAAPPNWCKSAPAATMAPPFL